MWDKRIISIVIVLLFFYIAAPLILPVALAAVFVVVVSPLDVALRERGLSKRFAAAIVTVLLTLGFLLPGGLAAFFAAKIGVEQLKLFRDAPMSKDGAFIDNILSLPGVRAVFDRLTTWFPITSQDLADIAGQIAKAGVVKLGDLLGNVLSQLPVLAAGMVVMVMSIYFLLADGPRLLAFVREKTTLPKRQLDRLINAFATMCRSVILASVVSGVIQSVLFGVAAAFVGTLNGLVVGFMVFISSFIPLIGTAPVTVGAALHQFVTGQNVAGVTFLIFALVVAVVDNFVRPMIYKGSGDLHPLLGFIAAFGGLFVLGFSGVFLGPVVAGLFVVTVEQLLRGD